MAPAIRHAVVGSRGFVDLQIVSRYVEALGPLVEVVSGDGSEVDGVAVAAAARLGRAFEAMPADWRRLGTAAGPIRNHEMIDSVDRVTAFWDGFSPGTRDAIAYAAWRRKLAAVVIGPGTREPRPR